MRRRPYPGRPQQTGLLRPALSCLPASVAEVPGIHPSCRVVELRPAVFTEGITGMDLLQDGRLAVCTWGGSQSSKGKVFLFRGLFLHAHQLPLLRLRAGIPGRLLLPEPP